MLFFAKVLVDVLLIEIKALVFGLVLVNKVLILLNADWLFDLKLHLVAAFFSTEVLLQRSLNFSAFYKWLNVHSFFGDV